MYKEVLPMNNNGMSNFLKIAIKSGRVKDVKEAFMDYPVEEEWHKGKIENIKCTDFVQNRRSWIR